MAKNKLTVCRHCGAQIAASAKVCPNCGGKNKKPIYKRVWFWILALILLAVIVSSAGGGDKKSDDKGSKKVGEVEIGKDSGQSKDEEKTEEESSAAEQSLQDAYYVGDILQDGDVRIVYAASGVYPGDEYMQPAEGNQYIFLKLAFENISEKSDSSVSFYSFEAYADGYACEMYYGGEEDLSATLSPGRKTMGYLYFEVPIDAKEIEIEYESNIWTDEKIKFVYEGEKDSGYQLEKDTEASADAHAVGETVEVSDLRVTCLSCEDYTSSNMFIEPAAGCHFVKLTFEFENTGSSDEMVSSFEFDCYADGINCKQTFDMDNDLSATISAGRKVQGAVIFEVPDDAQTVEAEYVSDMWTSERIVFTVQ